MVTESVPVKWLESPPSYNYGTKFGLPWHQGKYRADNATFTCTTPQGATVPLQSWITAYWPDDSIKWTAHAIGAGETSNDGYIIHATVDNHEPEPSPPNAIRTTSTAHSITISTGAITATFPRSGPHLLSHLTTPTATISTTAHLTLLLQSSLPDYTSPHPPEPISHTLLPSTTTSATLLPHSSGPLRATVRITGHFSDGAGGGAAILPFTIFATLHADSPAIHLTHTFTLSALPATTPFLRALELRFAVPLAGAEAWDRHVAFTSLRDGGGSGAGGGAGQIGAFREAAQPLTALWRDPGRAVRGAQVAGVACPAAGTWGADASSEVGGVLARPLAAALAGRYAPVWDAYHLASHGPAGFELRKRTQGGERAWVKVPGTGGRAGGVVFAGAAGKGGLGVGVKGFWEGGGGGLGVRGVAGEGEAEVQVGLWEGEGMDTRSWRGEGPRGYEEQVEAMGVTYEDWEEGMGSAEGVARTGEMVVWGTEGVVRSKELEEWTRWVRGPPVLVVGGKRVRETEALGRVWGTRGRGEVEEVVEGRLEFLFDFYKGQVEQRRWYGFWDYGDIMHTYDADRHTWRYDAGGYAWDNSELSPDLWLWLYFLRTGRADVYRMAEAMTRHTGEVDVYHAGRFKGLGTRHGVQHWSDSCKQARISNALYRRYFYYLSGGDERTGELLEETLETEKTYLVLDPYRKVRRDRGSYKPDAAAVDISLGTDWAALAAAWFTEWERRGPGWRDAKRKLLGTMRGIGALANGFVTGHASCNMLAGEINPPHEDTENKGVVKVSHLSAMFGLVEICADLLDSLQADTPPGFREAWLDYCRYFNAPAEDQIERFGVGFGKLQLRQGHSRLTAYAARELGDPELARRAWKEFFFSDGYNQDAPWTTERIEDSRVLDPIDEAPWISTNITSLYGLAAIQNLALVQDALPNTVEEMDALGAQKAAEHH